MIANIIFLLAVAILFAASIVAPSKVALVFLALAFAVVFAWMAKRLAEDHESDQEIGR